MYEDTYTWLFVQDFDGVAVEDGDTGTSEVSKAENRGIERGVALATVSNLLGHTSPTITLRYAHLSPKHLSSAVRVLDHDSNHSLDNRAHTGPRRSVSGCAK